MFKEVSAMFFKRILEFEFKRLFVKRNLVILAVLFILLAFLCWDGISDYKRILANKKPFQEVEREKVSLHLHYSYYGVRGIRLLFIPSPLSVIFNDSAVFDGMMASVDSTEKLEISNSLKGKDLFSDSGGFMDFAGIMLLIGSFLTLLYGWDGTRNTEYLKFISDISSYRQPGFFITLARIIFLTLAFWLLCGLALIFVLINGIDIANLYYMVYILELTLVITSFVAIGAIVGLIENKGVQLISLPVLYFVLVLLIPWLLQRIVYMDAKEGIKSIYEYEYQTFKYVNTFEKRFYDRFKVWKSGEVAPNDIKAMIQSGQEVEYKEMRAAEMKRMTDIVKRISVYQTLSSFFPTTFYISTNKELSSKGFQNFMNFYRYSYNMKQDFIKFYIDRKFYHALPQSGVEPFIKGDEDLYYGHSQLPKNFYLGILLNLIYIAVFLVALYRKQTQLTSLNKEEPVTMEVDFSKGNSIFMLCRTEDIKAKIFAGFKRQTNAACLDRIPINFQFNGLRIREVLNFLCKASGAKEDTAVEYLKVLGITELNSRVCLSPEDILKLYAAVKLARAGVEEVILDDFFKQKSREFESEFFKLLKILESSGKKIVYLSCEMFYPRYKANGKFKEEFETESFPMDYEKITLR